MKNKALLFLVSFCLLLVFFQSYTSARPLSKGAIKTTQIRIYTITKGKMEAFVDAWQKGVYPLRIKFGFKIENAWIVKEENKFIWTVSWEGPEDFMAMDSAYYASASRRQLQVDPAQYVAERQNYFLQPALPR